MRLPAWPRLATGLLVLVWLIPASLLIRRNSPWAPVATIALTVSVAGVVRRRPDPEAAAAPVQALPTIISPPLSLPPWKPLVHLSGAGALVIAALLAGGTSRSVAAGLFAGGATAIVLGRASMEQRQRLAGRHRRASVALAAILTLAGLIRWGVRLMMPSEESYYSASVQAARSESSPDLSFKGVILFVDKPPERIVPPSPLTLHSGFADPSREPLVIPFSGVYWFMRAPAHVPPATSLVRHGSPDELYFRAADFLPLTMEAHQHLGRHVSLSCCAGLDLELVNVDRFPGSVFVEVLLADTLGAGPTQSLGVIPVESTEFRIHGERRPRNETLHYRIRRGLFGGFDEITVRFHLSGVRNRFSARMAIQRFVLRPHGGA